MVSVECSVRVVSSQPGQKAWKLLLRMDRVRFKSLKSIKHYLVDRLRERMISENIYEFSLQLQLSRKREDQELLYEIHSEMDWKEYLPFLLEDQDSFGLCADVCGIEKPLLSPVTKGKNGQEVKKKMFGIMVNTAKSP